MCLLMGPQVIINNAFLAKKEQQSVLEISALRKFCNILYDKITGKNESGVIYKYVLFQVSEADVERFCDDDDQFVRGIGKVFCTGKVEPEKVEKINSVYPSEVQLMLKDAREAFAEL